MPSVVLTLDYPEDAATAATALRVQASQWRRAAERAAVEIEAQRRDHLDIRTASQRVVAALGVAGTLEGLADRLAAAEPAEVIDLPEQPAAAGPTTSAGVEGGEALAPAGSTPTPGPAASPAAAPAPAPVQLPADPRAAATVAALAVAAGRPVAGPAPAAPDVVVDDDVDAALSGVGA